MVAMYWQFVKFLILMLYKLTIRDFLIIMIMLHICIHYMYYTAY